MGARTYPVNVKITRTPLAGGADTVVEETHLTKLKRIKRLVAHATQSIGNQGVSLELSNLGKKFDSWASGDVVRVEAKRPQDAAYSLVGEGFIAEPEHEGQQVPVLRFDTVGLNAVLDIINLSQDHEYLDTPWTDIYDDLATTYLSGYTRTITADAAEAGYAKFPAGMKLREALDLCRRALNADTADKWETLVTKDGATRRIKLFKRDSTVARTIRAKDLLASPRLRRGSAFDVVNQADVYGATVPAATIDKTTLADAGSVRLDSGLERVAQPFIAPATPLYSHTTYATRSIAQDPNSLVGSVRRNSDNRDVLTTSFLRFGTVTILKALSGGTIGAFDDQDFTVGSQAQWNITGDTVWNDLASWDLGAGVTKRLRVLLVELSSSSASFEFRLEGSADGAAWTTVTTKDFNNQLYSILDATAYRYWRLGARRKTAGSAGGFNVVEMHLLEYESLATAPSGPLQMQSQQEGTGSNGGTTGNTQGAEEEILAKWDFGSAKEIAKLVYKHQIAVSSSLLNYVWQGSNDDSAWTDLIILASSTSIVTDTALVENASYRYLRLILRDDRAALSAGSGYEGFWTLCYFHIQTFTETGPAKTTPLVGDTLKGSSWTWIVDNLVVSPGFPEKQVWPAPRLALKVDWGYWIVYTPTSPSTTKWWQLHYGTETGAVDAQYSGDSGTTWSAIAADAVLLHVTEFNNAQLVGTAEDTASQTKYANFVPGGVLYGSLSDASLLTQDMVDKEVEALIKARADVRDGLVVTIPWDPTVEVGKRVTLHADMGLLIAGATGDYDVLEFSVDFVAGARMTLVLAEHPPEDVIGPVAAYATGRTQ